MKIPLILVNGSLGSGKTTLVKQLLLSPKFTGSFLIENEYANVNVDREALADEHSDEIYEISGSCICCSTGEELEIALDAMVARKWLKPVILEATGMANSAVLLRRLFLNPRFTEYFSILSTILLIDGADTTEISRGLEVEIKLSDIIIINKSDLAMKNVEALAEVVGRLNPEALLQATTQAAVDVDLIGKRESRVELVFGSVYAEIDNIELETASYAVLYLDKPQEPEKIKRALRPESFGPDVTFRRAKGFFLDPEGKQWQVEATAQHSTLYQPHTAKPQVIVAVGEGITKENLQEVLR
jgi:G3E family GTPase